VLRVCSVGGKAFCAGGDVRAVTESATKGESLYKDFFREEYKLNALIGTLHIPYIALIDGITMGKSKSSVCLWKMSIVDSLMWRGLILIWNLTPP